METQLLYIFEVYKMLFDSFLYHLSILYYGRRGALAQQLKFLPCDWTSQARVAQPSSFKQKAMEMHCQWQVTLTIHIPFSVECNTNIPAQPNDDIYCLYWSSSKLPNQKCSCHRPKHIRWD